MQKVNMLSTISPYAVCAGEGTAIGEEYAYAYPEGPCMNAT